MLKSDIAANLEQAFSLYGFAEPSVAKLQKASGVSLRTLYKHYPSKEAMIVGALEHRHQRYLQFISEHAPAKELDFALHSLDKLKTWMSEYAPHGCMSMNAVAAFPDNTLITNAVKQHKEEVRQLFAQRTTVPESALALLIIHEGVSSAWAIFGQQAVDSAKLTISQIFTPSNQSTGKIL